MLLGKRRISRTTSMKGINVDMNDVEVPEPSDPQNAIIIDQEMLGGPEGPVRQSIVVGPREYDHRLMGTLSPRYHMRSSGDDIETAHFLRSCGLCKRRLAPGRDIYMYRGDTAFCSQECREEQIKQDEREEKCSVAASKKDENYNSESAPPTGHSHRSLK
ncbi:hypothetical protein F0562_005488 [Nyssa sinensis]|uniref:FLZ-type domain-containing protein n=1 Tax=Nyssa sinensis TaxID=561372 RepID=A0A5J5AKV0_9ASTE|nr:hypothetical protein F0562_005488 [Nyssa sinensis]